MSSLRGLAVRLNLWVVSILASAVSTNAFSVCYDISDPYEHIPIDYCSNVGENFGELCLPIQLSLDYTRRENSTDPNDYSRISTLLSSSAKSRYRLSKHFGDGLEASINLSSLLQTEHAQGIYEKVDTNEHVVDRGYFRLNYRDKDGPDSEFSFGRNRAIIGDGFIVGNGQSRIDDRQFDANTKLNHFDKTFVYCFGDRENLQGALINLGSERNGRAEELGGVVVSGSFNPNGKFLSIFDSYILSSESFTHQENNIEVTTYGMRFGRFEPVEDLKILSEVSYLSDRRAEEGLMLNGEYAFQMNQEELSGEGWYLEPEYTLRIKGKSKLFRRTVHGVSIRYMEIDRDFERWFPGSPPYDDISDRNSQFNVWRLGEIENGVIAARESYSSVQYHYSLRLERSNKFTPGSLFGFIYQDFRMKNTVGAELSSGKIGYESTFYFLKPSDNVDRFEIQIWVSHKELSQIGFLALSQSRRATSFGVQINYNSGIIWR